MLRFLAVLGSIMMPATAAAQRQGLVSTFGDSAKITNGFAFSRDGRQLFTSEREAVGKRDGRHVWRTHQFGGRPGLSTSLYVYDIVGSALHNRRRLPFADDSLDYYPSLSHDGRRLYFNSRRPIAGLDSAGPGRVRVWYSELSGAGWGPALPAPGVNLAGSNSQYAQQVDDSTLIFSSDRPGSVPRPDGGPSLDLWEARRREGAWGPPSPIAGFNSPADEEGPFLDRSGRIFLFKRLEAGESHVFLSIREGGAWRPPRQVYLTDAGGFDEHGLRISHDGATFHFVHGLTMMHIALDSLLTPEERRLLGRRSAGPPGRRRRRAPGRGPGSRASTPHLRPRSRRGRRSRDR